MTGAAAFLFGKLQATNQTLPVNSQQLATPSVNSAIQPNSQANANTNQIKPFQPSNNNQSVPAQPANNNPIADHDTWISFSDSATSFPEGSLVAESASVPDLLVCDPNIPSSACQPNELLVYFVDASSMTGPGTEQIGLMRSADEGKTWSDRQHISISNAPTGVFGVDPSIVELSDGRLRLYYFGATLTQGDPASASGEHTIYSATSSDGLSFTQEDGTRFSHAQMTDPEVVQWKDTWYMLYSTGPTSGLATSPDGLTFTDQGQVTEQFGGVPGLLASSEGLRGYGCKMGIQSALSTDGKTFSVDATSVLPPAEGMICDPSVNVFKDSFVMVYKKAPKPTNSNNPNP